MALEKDLLIKNKLGLHARAAAQLVKTANRFSSEVKLTKDRNVVNGKSIMGVLMLVASKGSTVTLRAKGDKADECIAALAALIDDKFGEGK